MPSSICSTGTDPARSVGGSDIIVLVIRWRTEERPLAIAINKTVANCYGSIPKLVGFWIPDIALTTHIHQS